MFSRQKFVEATEYLVTLNYVSPVCRFSKCAFNTSVLPCTVVFYAKMTHFLMLKLFSNKQTLLFFL